MWSLRNVCILIIFHQFVDANLIVQTQNGPYRGEKRANYIAFEGIRYAAAPIGKLRFEPPQPYTEKHSDIWNATKPGNFCMQMNREFQVSGSEDCLFLNIYVPDRTGTFPVIFYIHGGGFIFGAGSQYLPGHMMKRDLILVTINYRLGPLGFLSGSSISGNMGMKDQVMALKFINENIANFNGDQDKIVIAGWSAGGASVQLHYMSPLSKNLFARGISHGGSALNSWVTQKNPEEKFKTVLKETGCSSVECLKGVPAEKVVQTIEVIQPYMANPFNPFGVVVEKDAEGAFLSEEPLAMLEQGKFQKLPWIASGVRAEGYYPCAEYMRDDYNRTYADLDKNFNKLIPLLLHFPANSSPKLPKIIREKYLGKNSITEESFNDFVKISTDYMYITGIQKSIQLQGPHMKVYPYAFDYKTQYAYGELMSHRKKVNAVAHGEDIILIYESSVRDGIPFSTDEIAVMNLLLDMYESFATNEVPMMSQMQMITSTGSDFVHIKGPDDVKIVRNYNFNIVSEQPFWENLRELIAPSSAIHLLPSILLISIIGSLTLSNILGNFVLY